MKDWERFELECYEYLKKKLGDSVKVKHTGGANSVQPDIVVNTNIAIETKMSRAQSGQFVVGYDDGADEAQSAGFYLAKTCVGSIRPSTDVIIKILNTNQEKYLDDIASQGWTKIEAEETMLEDWIINHYLHTKNEKFLMTGYLGGHKMLIKTTDLGKYFKVKAIMRYKPSGTRAIAKYDLNNAQSLLNTHLTQLQNTGTYSRLKSENITLHGKHYYVELGENLNKDDRYFGDDLYYLSPQGSGKYSVKRRGTTNNITVVFALDLIPSLFVPDQGIDALVELIS